MSWGALGEAEPPSPTGTLRSRLRYSFSDLRIRIPGRQDFESGLGDSMSISPSPRSVSEQHLSVGEESGIESASPNHAPNGTLEKTPTTKTRKQKSSLMRRIKKEVKKIGKEFREINDPGRESALAIMHRQIKSRNRINDSYQKVKNALKEMQDQYVASKDHKNVIVRYKMMKKMVREVTVYERQYWTLIDVPTKHLSESPETYINRVMVALEDRITTGPSGPGKSGLAGLLGSSAALAAQAREAQMLERLKSKSASELQKESAVLQADMVKLIKKYQGVRGLITQLHNAFESSKHYPIVPRYSLLKEMIKNVLRAPPFSEICHEIDD